MRDIVNDKPSAEELREWHTLSGKPIAKFFNTSGMRYKQMNLKDTVKTGTAEELIPILSSDGMLVKRPLLITDNTVLIGFKEEEWRVAFNK